MPINDTSPGARGGAHAAGRNVHRDPEKLERDRALGHSLDESILNDRYGVAGPSPLGEPVDHRPRFVRAVEREVERMGPRIRRRVRELRERTDARSVAALALFAAATAGAAVYEARGYPRRRLSRSGLWFRRLDKPDYMPPNWMFRSVWPGLYALIATSGWRVWQARSEGGPRRARTAALALWATQLGLNAAWSHTFFGRRRPALALADVGLLLGAVGGYTALARRVDRSAAWMMAPYLAWTTFTGVLNADIVRRNR